ncbi:hypothetical protein GCM10009744_02330 [Kribbella alba]|uniref:DUF2267 domain-containing protein n=1 Tax=Kribbella alba TaxID=190197 RepID=A0ABN2EVI0_9ACTN
MKHHEMVAAVKRAADLSSTEEAERALRATLRTLGERLAGGEPFDLASQLPGELQDELPPLGPGEPFGLDEFYRRVAEREGTDAEQARRHARAVMAVLRDAVSSGEFDDVLAQLPKEYADLTDVSLTQL